MHAILYKNPYGFLILKKLRCVIYFRYLRRRTTQGDGIYEAVESNFLDL